MLFYYNDIVIVHVNYYGTQYYPSVHYQLKLATVVNEQITESIKDADSIKTL